MSEEKKKVVKVKVKAKPKVPAQAEAPAEKPPKEKKAKPSGYVPFFKKWWFWFIVVGLALALLALIVQDRTNSGNSSSGEPVTSVTIEKPSAIDGSVTVDEVNQTVTVTLPPDFFTGQTKDSIMAEAEAEGFESCVVNSDGSVTYTMNKQKQAQILADFKRELDATISNLTSSGTSYRSITYNDNVSQINVKVDANEFVQSEQDQSYAAAFFMLAGYYQMFGGTPSEQVNVVISFADDASGRPIGTLSYQEAMAGI